MSGPVHEGGLFASLRRLLATTLEIAQVRLDILCTEIELEKRRIFDGLFWGAVALMITSVGLTLLCGFVILLFWDGYRLAAIGVMALLFLMGGVLLMREVRQSLSNPLMATPNCSTYGHPNCSTPVGQIFYFWSVWFCLPRIAISP